MIRRTNHRKNVSQHSNLKPVGRTNKYCHTIDDIDDEHIPVKVFFTIINNFEISCKKCLILPLYSPRSNTFYLMRASNNARNGN